MLFRIGGRRCRFRAMGKITLCYNVKVLLFLLFVKFLKISLKFLSNFPPINSLGFAPFCAKKLRVMGLVFELAHKQQYHIAFP